MPLSISRPLALAAVLVASAACASPSPQAPAPPVPAAEVGYQRVLAGSTLEGAPVSELVAGSRATVVIFFASWCGACRAELELLDRLRADLPDVRILGVNVYEEWGDYSDQQRLRRFLGDAAPWLEVVHGDEALMAAFGGVPKIPTLFVFDTAGAVVAEYRRVERPMPGEAELRALLAP